MLSGLRKHDNNMLWPKNPPAPKGAAPNIQDYPVLCGVLVGAVTFIAFQIFNGPLRPATSLTTAEQNTAGSRRRAAGQSTNSGLATAEYLEPATASASSQTLTAPGPQWQTFAAARYYEDRKYHLLLCATGSVAAIKIPSICEALSNYSNLSIRVVLSRSATKFLDGQSEEQPKWTTLNGIKNVDGVYIDSHEWDRPWKRGDDILHIELRRWADLMVIAPLSANGLAKMALGMSDNLVMSIVRAWDTTGQIDGVRPGIEFEGRLRKKTIMVAPAMNTAMWRHPVTMKHLRVLVVDWGVENGGWIELLQPIEKGLACGDVGSGGMKDWKTIVGDIERKFPRLSKEDDPIPAASTAASTEE